MCRFLPFVALLLAAAPVQAQRALAEKVEDLRRLAAVRAALALDAQTRPFDVGVSAEDGVVTLVGVVGTMGARERAEALASEVGGVRLVVNGLRLEGQPEVPATQTVLPAGEEESSEGEEEEPEAGGAEPEPEEPSTSAPRTAYHVVQGGDTLYSVARRYGTTVPALQRLNDLSSTGIRVGQRLRVR